MQWQLPTKALNRGQAPLPLQLKISSPSLLEPSPNGKVPKLSEEAKEFLDEANGASDPARSAWLAFLALLTYLLVTLAGVSHKDLLLNSPVGLPIVVNVDIPLFGFFQYAPALLLLVYLSLLIQHIILARKYRKFTEAIAPYEKETGKQHPARELVHSYVVSQILAGPKPNLITERADAADCVRNLHPSARSSRCSISRSSSCRTTRFGSRTGIASR